MNSKLVILYVMILSLMSCNLIGQKRQPFSPKDMANRHTEIMEEKLDLSDEQVKAVSSINLKYADEFQKMRQDAKGDREKMRTLRNDLVEKRNEEFAAVLTEEQFEEYIKLEEERAKEMKNGRRGGGRGER